MFFDKKDKCVVCKVKFKNKGNNMAILEIREKLNNGTLMYKCKSCSKSFCSKCGVAGLSQEKTQSFIRQLEGFNKGVYGFEFALKPPIDCPACGENNISLAANS